MIKLPLFSSLLCLTTTLSGYAMQPIVTLSGGMVSTLGPQSQQLVVANTYFSYQPENASAFNSMIGGSVGFESSLNQRWVWQSTLGYYQTGSTSISGEEAQAPISHPLATNMWDYHYKGLGRQLLWENKLLLTLPKGYHPYLSLGLGEGFNEAYGFKVTPQNSGEVATATFDDHHNTDFIYMAGVGLDKNLSEHVRLGLGYHLGYLGQYDLGKGELNTGAGGAVFSLPSLKSSHSLTQELLLQLTCLL